MDHSQLFEPASNFGPTFGAVVAYGFGLIVPLAMVLYSLAVAWYYERLGRRIQVATPTDVELSEGPAVLAGSVEFAAGSERAVRIEVKELSGEEVVLAGSRRQSRVQVSPFFLRRSSGDRIRVEPSNKVSLEEFTEWEAGFHMVYEIPRGARVVARGRLTRGHDPEADGAGYRDSPTGWVLRPSTDEPISISRIRPHEPFFAARRIHRWAAVVLLMVFTVMQLLLVAHWARVVAGERTTLTVESKCHYVTEDSEGADYHHYEVASRAPWGETHVDELTRYPWQDLEVGSQIPAIHVSSRFLQYGVHPTLPVSTALIVFITVIVVFIVWIAMTVAERPARSWREIRDSGWNG